jgi:AsmA protein
VRPKSWFLAGIAVVIALLAVAGLVLVRLAAPENLAPRIEAAVSAATGREFHLAGGMQLEFRPLPGLRFGAATLSGPPGDRGAPLLAWRAAHIGAQFWPLLRGRLELDGVTLDGLQLNLRRDASGRGNWEGLGAAPTDASANAGGGLPFGLSGLRLRDARLEYSDAVAGTRLVLESLSLDVGRWANGQPVDLEGRFDLSVGATRVLRAAVLHTRALFVAPALSLAGTQLRARLGGAGLPEQGVAFTLDMPRLQYDSDAARLEVPAAQLAIAAAQVALSGIRFAAPDAAAATLQADFRLAAAQPRAILAALGRPAPATTDPKALGALAAQGRIASGAQGLRIEPFMLTLDATRLDGWLARAPAGVLEFELRGNTMDLDRYREPAGTASEPFVFPTATLAALRARGTLTLQGARFNALDLDGVTLRLLLDENGLRGAAPGKSP